MTIQECCSVFTTVAVLAGVASAIHSLELRNKVDRYILARWQREEGKEAAPNAEEKASE